MNPESLKYNLEQIFQASAFELSHLRPSDWYEQNMVMPRGSAFPGPYRYKRSPYLREIIDCLGKDHPAHTVAVMKGAQIGVSAGVLTPAVGYIIAENPGNILFLTGHSDLSDEAMLKIDQMIDNCGIRHLIKPNVLRKKNSRTGDTNKSKEFPGGTLVAGSATNHNLLRQRDIMYAIVDDFDAAKKSSKETGSTTKLIEQRTAGFATKRKVWYVSTPQLKGQSNIEPAFLLGDQRYYHIPCPHCGEFIVWKWETKLEGSENEKAGITWKLAPSGKLIESSVGYICQKCGGFFNDRNKQEYLESGEWIPTAEPSQFGYYSYHISALYAPVGMFSWAHYVNQYLEANPENADMDVAAMKTFTNVVLGETWEDEAVEVKATQLQLNQRNYKPGTIPELISKKDGNGQIVLLTLAADLNGKEDDARLDWEIVAWSETGTSYSVKHGSIGTFIPREGEKKADREHWTYRKGATKNVWDELDKILATVYHTDSGRKMKVFIAGIDAGYMSEYVYPYVDGSNFFVLALKGDVGQKYNPYQRDAKMFKPAKEKSGMFILESNVIKDEVAKRMMLKWDQKNDDHQPAGFMNFPESSDGLYQFSNFFSHFEAEKRTTATNAQGEPVGTKWEKKDSTVQNHLFDCFCYNFALKEILTEKVCRELKVKEFHWKYYVDAVLGRL